MTPEHRNALQWYASWLRTTIDVLQAKLAMIEQHGPTLADMIDEGREREALALWKTMTDLPTHGAHFDA